ncbi:MAG: hypothetical protein C5S44_12245, partial [Candidatus Methanocomedens sp.]
TIPEYYAETCVDYGQVIKIREGGKVVDKIKIIVYGSPSIDEIETTDIENMNSIFRERIGRLVRKTKSHSKKKPKLVNAVELFQFYWNFMDRLPKRGTPAMIENLTDHQWSWEEFFYFPLSILNQDSALCSSSYEFRLTTEFPYYYHAKKEWSLSFQRCCLPLSKLYLLDVKNNPILCT